MMASPGGTPEDDVSAMSAQSGSDWEDNLEDPDFSLTTELAETLGVVANNDKLSQIFDSALGDSRNVEDVSGILYEDQGPAAKKRKVETLDERNLLAAIDEDVLNDGGDSDGDSEASDVEAVLQALEAAEETGEEDGFRVGVMEDTITRDVNMPEIYVTKLLFSDVDPFGRKKKDPRVYNRKTYCPGCNKLVQRWVTHVIRQRWKKHKNVAEFKDIHNLLDEIKDDENIQKSAKYEELLQLMKSCSSRAVHQHNMEVLQQKRGELIIARRARGATLDVSQYGPCPHCLRWYYLQRLFSHQKKCGTARNVQPLSQTTTLVQSAFLAGRMDHRVSLELRTQVLPSLGQQAAAVVMDDPLLVARGNQCLIEKKFDDKVKRVRYTRAVLIKAGRLKIELNSLLRPDSGSNISDYLTMEHFPQVVKAAGQAMKKYYKTEINAARASSFQKHFREMVRKLAALKLSIALQDKESHTRREARQFLRCISAYWPQDMLTFDMKKLARDVDEFQLKLGAGDCEAEAPSSGDVPVQSVSRPAGLEAAHHPVALPFQEDIEKLYLHVDGQLAGLDATEAQHRFHTMCALAMVKMVLTNPNAGGWITELRYSIDCLVKGCTVKPLI